jgi:hypothetical protein
MGIVLSMLAGATPVALRAQAPPAAPGDLLHRIVPGDTLIALARRHLDLPHGWRGLQRVNAVAEPRRLRPGGTLRLPAAWLKAEPARAEAVHVRGEVTVERGTAAAQPVLAGAWLQVGDLLRAGPDSSLTLRFADGSRLLLRPDSTLRLSTLRQRPGSDTAETGLRLDQGSADSRVAPLPAAAAAAAARRYEITTPTLHLGVRGTEFRTRVDPEAGTTHLEVIEGTVAAANGRAEQRVAAGQGAVAAAGARPLTAAALAPPPDLSGVPQRVERVPLRRPGFPATAWPAGARRSSIPCTRTGCCSTAASTARPPAGPTCRTGTTSCACVPSARRGSRGWTLSARSC